MPQRPYQLSCHCGAIRLEVDAELTDLLECNCSTCGRFGMIRWKVPVETVRLVSQKRQLISYHWQDIDGGVHFCPTCCTPMFRSGWGTHLGLNARCVEGVDFFTLQVQRYDGRQLMPPGPTI